MRAKDFISEIDRRGFLKGFGAAAAAAAMPSLANAKDVIKFNPQDPEDLNVLKYVKAYWKKNLKTPKEVPAFNHVVFKVRFNGKGEILSVALEGTTGNPELDNAVKNSIKDIPDNVLTHVQLQPEEVTFIRLSTKGYLPEPNAIGSGDKETGTGDSEVSKVQKAVSAVLKERPNSSIEYVSLYQVPKENQELIIGEGDFGNNLTFFILSVSGWKQGMMARALGGDDLSIPYQPSFGNDKKKENWLFALGKYGTPGQKYFVNGGTISNSKTDNKSQLSKFSIKGLKFGMSKEEIDKIKSANNIGGGVGGLLSGTDAVNFGSLLGVSSKPNEYSKSLGKELSMSGMPGYLSYKGGRLVAISIVNKSEIIQELADRMLEKFKGGQVLEKTWQNKIGHTFPNKEYRWENVDGASIRAIVRDKEVDVGTIIFASTEDIESKIKKQQADKKNAGNDFE
jgi:hypothetical protein